MSSLSQAHDAPVSHSDFGGDIVARISRVVRSCTPHRCPDGAMQSAPSLCDFRLPASVTLAMNRDAHMMSDYARAVSCPPIISHMQPELKNIPPRKPSILAPWGSGSELYAISRRWTRPYANQLRDAEGSPSFVHRHTPVGVYIYIFIRTMISYQPVTHGQYSLQLRVSIAPLL